MSLARSPKHPKGSHHLGLGLSSLLVASCPAYLVKQVCFFLPKEKSRFLGLASHPVGKLRWCSGKESTCQGRRCKRRGFDPWVRTIPWSRKWQPAPVFLSGEFHGQRSLVGYSPWGHKESDMTEHAHTLTSDATLYSLLTTARCFRNKCLKSFQSFNFGDRNGSNKSNLPR